MDGIVLQDRVRMYLKENGIMQRFLAEKLNVSQPALSQWLRCKSSLKHETLERIRDIVGRV